MNHIRAKLGQIPINPHIILIKLQNNKFKKNILETTKEKKQIKIV